MNEPREKDGQSAADVESDVARVEGKVDYLSDEIDRLRGRIEDVHNKSDGETDGESEGGSSMSVVVPTTAPP